jgi:hypothetical protein
LPPCARFPRARTAPQLPADLLHVDHPAFVGEGGIACDHEQPAHPRECRDDFFDHAISEVLLLRIAAHVLEWQHGNRWFVGQCEHRRLGARHCSPPGGIEDDTVNMNGLSNVLQILLAQIFDIEGDFAARVIEYGLGYADAARLG